MKLYYSLIITAFVTLPISASMHNHMPTDTYLKQSKHPHHIQPSYQAIPQYEPQLKLSDDALDAIIASCSYRTRSKLRATCKQLYYLGSIDRLEKLIIHNFNIGNDVETEAFFKAIVSNNNLNHIETLYNFAKKKPYYIF